jgi:hypothetical protein
MKTLNLPGIDPTIREGKTGRPEIFDPCRRRFVRLTPEEWVRQHMIGYLTRHLGYPTSLIVSEAALLYNGMKKRFDLLVYLPNRSPYMIVECKAPDVALNQSVFDQAGMYNMTLMASIVVITNGFEMFACRVDHSSRNVEQLTTLPEYTEVLQNSVTLHPGKG